MPGRTYTASTATNYRFGFNGKENDNEVKGVGDQQDYGMRYYDPRAGRFMSVDPLTSKYPFYSPYQFSGNNPIKFIDVDGMEPGDPGGVQSDAPSVAPKYQGGAILNPTPGDNSIDRVERRIYRLAEGLAGLLTQSPAAMSYGDKIPKDKWAQEFPAIPNNNIYKDIIVPGIVAPFKTLKDISKDPTNVEAWTDAVLYALPLLNGKAGMLGRDAESSLTGGSRDINPLGGQYNCAGCTIAGDASLKGFPASAIEHGPVYVTDFLKHFGATQMNVYKSTDAIIDIMNKANEGATGVIFGDRGPGVMGHFFNVTKQNGVVQFIDFQKPSGYRTVNPSTIMQQEGFERLWFLNTTLTNP